MLRIIFDRNIWLIFIRKWMIFHWNIRRPLSPELPRPVKVHSIHVKRSSTIVSKSSTLAFSRKLMIQFTGLMCHRFRFWLVLTGNYLFKTSLTVWFWSSVELASIFNLSRSKLVAARFNPGSCELSCNNDPVPVLYLKLPPSRTKLSLQLHTMPFLN